MRKKMKTAMTCSHWILPVLKDHLARNEICTYQIGYMQLFTKCFISNAIHLIILAHAFYLLKSLYHSLGLYVILCVYKSTNYFYLWFHVRKRTQTMFHWAKKAADLCFLDRNPVTTMTSSKPTTTKVRNTLYGVFIKNCVFFKKFR